MAQHSEFRIAGLQPRVGDRLAERDRSAGERTRAFQIAVLYKAYEGVLNNYKRHGNEEDNPPASVSLWELLSRYFVSRVLDRDERKIAKLVMEYAEEHFLNLTLGRITGIKNAINENKQSIRQNGRYHHGRRQPIRDNESLAKYVPTFKQTLLKSVALLAGGEEEEEDPHGKVRRLFYNLPLPRSLAYYKRPENGCTRGWLNFLDSCLPRVINQLICSPLAGWADKRRLADRLEEYTGVGVLCGIGQFLPAVCGPVTSLGVGFVWSLANGIISAITDSFDTPPLFLERANDLSNLITGWGLLPDFGKESDDPKVDSFTVFCHILTRLGITTANVFIPIFVITCVAACLFEVMPAGLCLMDDIPKKIVTFIKEQYTRLDRNHQYISKKNDLKDISTYLIQNEGRGEGSSLISQSDYYSRWRRADQPPLYQRLMLFQAARRKGDDVSMTSVAKSQLSMGN